MGICVYFIPFINHNHTQNCFGNIRDIPNASIGCDGILNLVIKHTFLKHLKKKNY